MPVFTEEFDPDIIWGLSQAGVVDAIDLDSDAPTVMRIKDPYKFAYFTGTKFNRVPGAATAWIKAGLSSVNQQDVEDASAAYAMLLLHAPQLANAMDLGGEGSLGATRASLIGSRIQQGARTAGANNEFMRSRVSTMMKDVMAINPEAIKVNNQQVWGLAWWSDDAHHFQDTNAETTLMARKDVAAAANEIGFDEAESESIPAEVVNDYKQKVAQEYRIAKSTMPDTAAAMMMAKKRAMARTLQSHRPYQWEGNQYFDATGDMPSSPALQALIESEILKPPPGEQVGPEFQKAREKMVAELRNDYVPVWDKQQQGFVFRHKVSGLLKTTWDSRTVQPLVVDVLNVANQPIEERVRQFIEEKRKKAKEGQEVFKKVKEAGYGSFIPYIP